MKQSTLVVLLIVILLGAYGAAKVVPTYLPQLVKSLVGEPSGEMTADTDEVDGTRQPAAVGAPVPFALEVPEEFAVSVFAEGLNGPRVLTRDPHATFVVSETRAGNVVALPNRDEDGKADERVVILSGLDRPHGLLFRCNELGEEPCFLYVAEEGVVSEYRYDAATMSATERRELIALPTEGDGHYTRTLMEEPGTGRLLVSVGSSCNVCNEEDERRAAIISTDFDGAEPSVFARGLRNAVFMTLHPVTGEIWATEMGRDFLGDNLPPDEVNIVREGGNYGWPICYGDNVHDTDFDKNTYIRNPCIEPFETPSRLDIQAHSAPLGLAFIPEEGWPEDMWFDLIVAYHGSWNRSEPTGYKLVRFDLDAEGRVLGQEDFVTGWLRGGSVRGRPVDVYVEPGGVMYITDDHASMIYRLVYQGS